MPPKPKQEVKYFTFTIVLDRKRRLGTDTAHEALAIAIRESAFVICAQQGQLLRTYTDAPHWEVFRKYYGLVKEELPE